MRRRRPATATDLAPPAWPAQILAAAAIGAAALTLALAARALRLARARPTK